MTDTTATEIATGLTGLAISPPVDSPTLSKTVSFLS